MTPADHPTRLAILGELSVTDAASVHQLAERIGLGTTHVWYHLQRLEESGEVERLERGERGGSSRRHLYRLCAEEKRRPPPTDPNVRILELGRGDVIELRGLLDEAAARELRIAVHLLSARIEQLQSEAAARCDGLDSERAFTITVRFGFPDSTRAGLSSEATTSTPGADASGRRPGGLETRGTTPEASAS